MTIEAVQARVGALLSGPDSPTAVITNSDYTAHAVYKAARERCVPVGSGISVVGHDDLPTSELLDPPLTTLRLDRRAMGRALMVRLLDPGVSDDHVEPVSLVERASIQRPESVSSAIRNPRRRDVSDDLSNGHASTA